MRVTPRIMLTEMLILMVFVRELDELDAGWALIEELEAEAASPFAAVGVDVPVGEVVEFMPIELAWLLLALLVLVEEPTGIWPSVNVGLSTSGWVLSEGTQYIL